MIVRGYNGVSSHNGRQCSFNEYGANAVYGLGRYAVGSPPPGIQFPTDGSDNPIKPWMVAVGAIISSILVWKFILSPKRVP